MKHSPTLLATLLFLVLSSSSSRAFEVGDPRKPADLPRAILTAYASGQRDITIRPGVYLLPAGDADTLLLDQWHDATLSGNGVTLVFNELRHRPVRLLHCNHLTLRGFTFRFVSHACSQGRIKALGDDADGKYCDWQIDTGYPNDVTKLGKTLNLVDQQTRLIKAGTSDIGVKSAATLAPGLYRLRFNGPFPSNAAVNDWLVARYPGGSTLLHLDGSENVTVQSVICQNGGFGTFFETGGGANHFLACKVTFGPKPPGAAEAPIVSCGADGFHSVNTTIGPEIRDCVFEGVFLDDCIAIHGTFEQVAAVEGNVVTFEPPGDGGFAVGDPVRFSDKAGFFAEATCTNIERAGRKTRVTLDRALPIPAGAKGNNPNRCGRGYRIVNTRLGDTRSRGILVKADDGIIDHCTIRGCVMSGVSIGPEYYWNEANYCRNVTVSNCTFDDCNKSGGDHGAIFVHGDGAIGNRNIVIRHSSIQSPLCHKILNLQWADGIDILDNRFVVAPLRPKTFQTTVFLTHCRNVKLRNNALLKQGADTGRFLEEGPDVSGTDNE